MHPSRSARRSSPPPYGVAERSHESCSSHGFQCELHHIESVMNLGCCEDISLLQRSLAIRLHHQWLGSLGVVSAVRFAFLRRGSKDRRIGLERGQSADDHSQRDGISRAQQSVDLQIRLMSSPDKERSAEATNACASWRCRSRRDDPRGPGLHFLVRPPSTVHRSRWSDGVLRQERVRARAGSSAGARLRTQLLRPSRHSKESR